MDILIVKTDPVELVEAMLGTLPPQGLLSWS
jgi:hypothetical protein